MNLMYLNYCMIIIVHNEMRWSYRCCWEMIESYYALLELYTCHLLNYDQNVEGFRKGHVQFWNASTKYLSSFLVVIKIMSRFIALNKMI